MDLPQDYLFKLQSTERQPGEPRSGWEEQLDRFAQRLNPERERAGFKPYTHERIGKLLANYGAHNEGAAAAFYKRLDTHAKNFGALFNKLTRAKGQIPKVSSNPQA